MSRRQLFLRLLVKAAWVRKDRALTALTSVAVVATIATAALAIYSTLETNLSREFRSFGANVIVTSRGESLTPAELSGLTSILGNKGTVVPVAYAIAAGPNGTKVVVGGADLKKLRDLNSWWALRPAGSGDALIGERAAKLFSPTGSAFVVSFANRTVKVTPQEIFVSGSDDDSRIYVSLEQFTAGTNLQPNTALVRVDGRPREIQYMVNILRLSLLRTDVQPVRQITQAQASVVGKTRAVVLAASLIVLVMIMLCMAATFTSSVLERRKDFAVMKALGASNRTVNLLFAAEAALLSLAGGVIGFVLGSVVAYLIGRINFSASILPAPELIVPVLLGSMVLALIASTAPLRTLQQIQPAGILRGE